MWLGAIISIAGIAGVGIWMYNEGYKDGYNKGAQDGYSVKK
jgi:hypothetical protein